MREGRYREGSIAPLTCTVQRRPSVFFCFFHTKAVCSNTSPLSIPEEETWGGVRVRVDRSFQVEAAQTGDAP